MAKIGTSRIAAPQVPLAPPAPQIMDTGQKQQIGTWGAPEKRTEPTVGLYGQPNFVPPEMGQMRQEYKAPVVPHEMFQQKQQAVPVESAPIEPKVGLQPKVVNGVSYLPDVKWAPPPTESMPTYQGTVNYETTGGADGKAWFWYNGSWHINTHYSPQSAEQGQNPNLIAQQNPLMTAGPDKPMLNQPSTLNIQSMTPGEAPASNTGYWGTPGKKTMWGA